MQLLDLRQTNRLNIIFQSFYSLFLAGLVINSYRMETASLGYVIGFLIIVIIGFSLVYIVCLKNRYSESIKFILATAQTLMYFVVMIFGHAESRFACILPIFLCLVLYHSVSLMVIMSAPTIMVNLLNVIVCIFVLNKVSFDDYTRYVIQLIVIGGAVYIATMAAAFYKKSYNRNISQQAELAQANISTIETIANTIDAKDAYTQGHSRRVAEYAETIARQMGKFSEEELKDIHYIGLLHDVGKITVPDSILNKPTKLTNEEFNVMKIHTTVGAEILKNVRIIKGIIAGVKYHHERYDGSGYPDGLKGEEIPEVARIISLADAYDAMTSSRVYRKPLSAEHILSEIKSHRGTQFAPDVVDAFLECVKNNKLVPPADSANPCGYRLSERSKNADLDTCGWNVSPIADLDEVKNLKDELTGAYLVKYGMGAIEQNLIEKKGTLALFNIVGLRKINHELGFKVGDYYIKKVAETIIKSEYAPFTTRLNGNQFLCYLENLDKDEATVFIEDCLNRVATLEENDPHMEKSLDLTCAAKVVVIPKSINEHIENLQKVLFLLKGKEGEYAFYDLDEDKKHIYDISKDMEMLINTIKSNKIDSISEAMGSRNVSNAINLIKEHPDETVGVAIFTIKPMDEEHIISVNLDYAIEILETGMNYAIQNEGYVFDYSSLQRTMIMFESAKQGKSWNEYFDILGKEVLNFFHKNYDKIDVEISFSTAVID